MRARVGILAALLLTSAAFADQVPDRRPAEPSRLDQASVTAAQVTAAIGKLATVDYPIRMDAARTVRRAAGDVAVPALVQAAAGHADNFVRFRALVLLSGFNDPRTRDVMVQALGVQSDRLRAVAYEYFESNPDPQILSKLIDALTREESEFTRPSLTRALAAYGSDPRVQKAMNGLVLKGQDFFRSTVIEALGDYKAAYALPAITEVARLNGPLQDDALLALGKIGDKKSLPVLIDLQGKASKAMQPHIAAAICLLGVNCSSHQRYLTESLRFAVGTIDYQELVRASAHSLSALAIAGREDAAATLVEIGAPTRDPARAAIALAIGAVALRNTPLMLKMLERQADTKPAMELLRESFDMLEEDLEEERFFVTVRRSYWQAAEGSPARKLANTLIQSLEF
jgi:HEAT repeat protein